MGKLFKYLKPYTLVIIALLTFVFLQVLTELYLPTLMADIVDEGIVRQDTAYIWQTGLIMLAVALFGGITMILASFLASKVGSAFGRDIRKKVFHKASNFSLHEIDQVGTASLITRTTNDITQVQNVMVMLLRMFTRAPLMAVGSIIMAVQKDVPLTYVIIVVVIILGVFIALVATRAIPLFTSLQKKVDRLNLVLRERLTGIRVIRAFNRTSYEEKRFDESSKDLMDTAIKVNKLLAIVMPVIMLFFNVTMVALIWFGAVRINAGGIQVGDMMAFINYAMQIMMSVMMLMMIFIMYPRASASAKRINEVLEMEVEIKNPDQPKTSTTSRGKLTFENVNFAYHSDHEAKELALEGISFTSNPGEITAIIGGTGSGKSTLINLVPRFYDVTSGCVKINDIDVRDYDLKDLRQKIGLVPQQALLFSGSVEENLSFGSGAVEKTKLEKYAAIAQSTDFINEMDGKYEATISQGGTNVSGGQKQRLSIARALVKEPEIYIFDDSFSALDYKTEAKLRKALEDETKESTVLVVAQKVTSVMNADRIIVLDEGKVVGLGTHKELLENNRVYQEIVASQLSEEELA